MGGRKMKYTSDMTLGNYEIYEVYEGSPEEIAELKHMIDNEPSTKQFGKIEGELRGLLTGTPESKEEQVYDIDEAAEYISKHILTNTFEINELGVRELVEEILELEEDYMKLIGIIE